MSARKTTKLRAGDRWPSAHRDATTRKHIPKHIRYGVFMRDGWRCCLCGAYYEHTPLHLDHIQPWASGGPDTSTNLRTLCASCNLKKSNRYYPEDLRTVLPIAAGCQTCQQEQDHDNGQLAYCLYCDATGYSQHIDRCWLQNCDCR